MSYRKAYQCGSRYSMVYLTGESPSGSCPARSFRCANPCGWIFASLHACDGSYYGVLRFFVIVPGVSDGEEILRTAVGFPCHHRNLAGQLFASLHVFQPFLVARIFRIYGFCVSLVLGSHKVAAVARAMGRFGSVRRPDGECLLSECHLADFSRA